MNLETKITIYKFTPQVFTLTLYLSGNTFCLDNSGNGTEFYSTFFEW